MRIRQEARIKSGLEKPITPTIISRCTAAGMSRRTKQQIPETRRVGGGETGHLKRQTKCVNACSFGYAAGRKDVRISVFAGCLLNNT